MADCSWQRVAANPDREKITFSTFKISIIGRVKNTTDLDRLAYLLQTQSFLFQKS
jgi:hypothetical protein